MPADKQNYSCQVPHERKGWPIASPVSPRSCCQNVTVHLMPYRILSGFAASGILRVITGGRESEEGSGRQRLYAPGSRVFTDSKLVSYVPGEKTE